jgi:peptidoglycan/xylan/chitin deacetylase (PgdA/CDA1 family)
MGKTDTRILSALVENKMPATIIDTARWLKHNQPFLTE